MTSRLLNIVALALAISSVSAVTPSSTGRPGHGLIGYGIDMYLPDCAFACKNAIPTTLLCSDAESMVEEEHGGMSGMSMKKRQDSMEGMNHSSTTSSMDNSTSTMLMESESPSPLCLSTNTPYLQTMAYCLSAQCPDSVSVAARERFWGRSLIGSLEDQPLPNMTYEVALKSISSPPTEIANASVAMATAVLVDPEAYDSTYNALVSFERAEDWHSETSVILVSLCVGLPFALSLTRFIPFPPNMINWIRATFIDSPLIHRSLAIPIIGRYAKLPRGVALFLFYIIAINIILCSVQIKSASPNAWFMTPAEEVLTYVANRTGVLSFANIPLIVLFAGRNNLLLGLTDWSYETFLAIHKCVAWISTIQACIHSAMYLHIKLEGGVEALFTESALPYWIMGIVGTLSMVILLPLSIRYLRHIAYEAFLLFHIFFAALALVGCWYHIVWRFDHQWGYETWLYISFAIWAFDRIVRVLRMVKNGFCYAKVYRIDDDYIRIDIPRVSADGHVFLYFPTITTPWQNHPFSVASNNSMAPRFLVPAESPELKDKEGSSEDGLESINMLKHSSSAGNQLSIHNSAQQQSRNTTIIARVHKGVTKTLSQAASPLLSTMRVPSFPVLVESSYGRTSRTISSLVKETSTFPNVICIAGGVGITGLLPFLQSMSSHNEGTSVKLFWGTRSQALVTAVGDLQAPSAPWTGIEAHVTVGARMDLDQILTSEIGQTPTLLLVCGPKSMSDEVRLLSAQKASQGHVMRFVQDAFDW